MAVSNVELIVNAAKAINPLKQVEQQTNRLDRQFGNLKASVNALGGVFAGLGVGLIAKQAISAAASFNDLQLRLKILTSEYGEFEQAQALAAKAASTFGLSNREATEGITDIFARLRPLGVSLREIESTFIGFNTVAKLSGTSTVEAASAFRQLSQALGSGALQGDEFRSISEQVPKILVAISNETGVASGDLKEYAKTGKITSEVVIRALQRIEKEGADSIKKIVEESDVQRFKDFENATGELSVAIGNELLPAALPLVDALTGLVSAFGDLPGPIQTASVGLLAVAGSAAILGPALGAVNTAVVGLIGAASLGGLITSLAVVGEKALAAAAGKKVLAAAVTAANVKITAATVSAGLLKVALMGIPFVAIATGVTALGVALFNANKKQNEFNETVKEGKRAAVEAALATEELRKTQARQQLDELPDGGRTGKNSPFARRLKRIEADANARIALLKGRLGEIKKVEDELKQQQQDPPVIETDAPEDMSARMLELNQRLGQAEDKNQDRIAATLKLMIERQRIAESEIGPRQRIFELEEAQRNFKKEILGIDQDIADEAQKKADADKKVLLPLERQAELLQARLDGTEEEVQRRHDIEDLLDRTNNLDEEGAALLIDKLNLLKEQNAETDKLKANFAEIGATIKTGMVDGIMAAIEGTQSFSESLSGILKQLARMFIQTGVSQAGQALKIPGFANGGNPPVGKMSVVGEKGPELFVPKTAGTIVPNHAIGSSNIVVNVDASGSNVQGDGQQSKALGQAIGAAVQAEIVKQKMPGGLLN